MLDVVQPFESMLSPFCCIEFLRVVHHHRRLWNSITLKMKIRRNR